MPVRIDTVETDLTLEAEPSHAPQPTTPASPAREHQRIREIVREILAEERERMSRRWG
jgi:hypothetical protein